MNLTKLAATGTALDLALAEVRGQVTIKRLRTRHARKTSFWAHVNGALREQHRPAGSTDDDDEDLLT
jgi:hypothetical protein